MEDFGIPKPRISLRERASELPEGEKLPIVEVRVGSHSDFPKIKEILTGLEDYPLLVRIASAHRTPEAMIEMAKAFPNVLVSLENEGDNFQKPSEEVLELAERLEIKTCIAAAGGSAHIAGMTASDTHIPVLAYPVSSSTNGQYESDASMRHMPPGIPNGTSAYEAVLVDQAKKIYNIDVNGSQEVYIDPELSISDAAQKVIDETGIKTVSTLENNPQIGIFDHTISDDSIDHEGKSRKDISKTLVEKTGNLGTPITIVNPIYTEPLDTNERTGEGVMKTGFTALNLLTTPGLSMGASVDKKTNLTNSLTFAAQILGLINPGIQKGFKENRLGLGSTVRQNDGAIVHQQLK